MRCDKLVLRGLHTRWISGDSHRLCKSGCICNFYRWLLIWRRWLRVRFFGKIRIRTLMQDHSNHGASKEPTNPYPRWIRRFLWYTMIRVILDQKWGFGFFPKKPTRKLSHSLTEENCFCRRAFTYLAPRKVLLGVQWIDNLRDDDDKKVNRNKNCQHSEELIVSDYLLDIKSLVRRHSPRSIHQSNWLNVCRVLSW